MNNQKLYRRICLLGVYLTLCFLSQPVFSQSDSLLKSINLSYKDYMQLVMTKNLEYAAEKFNVSISEAKIEAVKVFQNPTLSFDWSGNNSDNSYSTEIGKTFEFGKRMARINLAKSENLLANEMLNDYLRNLQADATLEYLNAMKQSYLYQVMVNSYEMLKELSNADSIRLSLGSIKSIDASQSKLEAGVLFNDLVQIDSDRKNSFISLSNRTSTYHADALYFPTGEFGKIVKIFVLNDLIVTALNGRADLMVAKYSIDYSKDLLTLTKRERRTDIDLKVGASNSKLNNGFFTSSTAEISAGIAIPLKFSNLNRGEVKIAKYQVEQSELQYKQVEVKIQNEVMQAYNLYQSLCKQVKNYDLGLLEQAKTVLNGKTYSYSRGETSLLEVLNAQRTYNDLQTSYYETLYNCYAALVELERAVGIWDIEL